MLGKIEASLQKEARNEAIIARLEAKSKAQENELDRTKDLASKYKDSVMKQEILEQEIKSQALSIARFDAKSLAQANEIEQLQHRLHGSDEQLFATARTSSDLAEQIGSLSRRNESLQQRVDMLVISAK